MTFQVPMDKIALPDVLFLILSHLTTFGNIVAKGAIANNDGFLLLAQYFQLYSITLLSYIEISIYLLRDFQSHLLQICCGRVFRFPTPLQQMSFENTATKGEIKR